jgi:hypothetical protein
MPAVPLLAMLAMLAGLLLVDVAMGQDGGVVQVKPRPARGLIDPRVMGGMQVKPRLPAASGLAAVSGEFDLKAIRMAAVPADLRAIVARFEDPDWSTREEAARRLEAHPAPDEALLRILDQDELSEEQRQRLMGVISRRILLRERGAIGIRMSTRGVFGDNAVSGVEVTELLPGLPAERVLDVGDVITQIDERAIRVNADLITHVQRMPPGQVIEVVVMRPRFVEAGKAPDPAWIRGDGDRWFERIDVEFALGSFSQLGDTATSLNPETTRRQQLVFELRTIWDRPGDRLDGRVTIDGVMPPDAAELRGIPSTPRLPGR